MNQLYKQIDSMNLNQALDLYLSIGKKIEEKFGPFDPGSLAGVSQDVKNILDSRESEFQEGKYLNWDLGKKEMDAYVLG